MCANDKGIEIYNHCSTVTVMEQILSVHYIVKPSCYKLNALPPSAMRVSIFKLVFYFEVCD